jgi:1-acyl-sn-glycerol-3-phosphate acyltransferase
MGRTVTTVLVLLWAPIANLLWYLYTVVMALLSLALWPFDRTASCSTGAPGGGAGWWPWTIFARIHVHGVEQVRRGRPYVYMANHASLIDTPALFAYLPYQFRIMAKKSLFNVPFMGWHLRTAGHFPIDQGNPGRRPRACGV